MAQAALAGRPCARWGCRAAACCWGLLGPPLALLLPYGWRLEGEQIRAAAAQISLAGGARPFPRASYQEAEQLFERHVREQRPLLITGCEHLLSRKVPRTWEEAAAMREEYAHANRRSLLGLSALAKHFPNNINIWVPQDRIGDHIATPPFWAAGGSAEVPEAAMGTLEAHPQLAKYIVSHRGAFFATHRDMYRENLEMIVTGEKLVLMFPPTKENYAKADPRVMHKVNASRDTQGAGYPTVKRLSGLEGLYMGVVRAGEIVYVPSDWFHFFMPTVRFPETQMSYCWRRTSAAARQAGCERLEMLLGDLLHELNPARASGASLPAPARAFRDAWLAANRSACPYVPGLAEQLLRRNAWPGPARKWLRARVLSPESPA